MMRESRKRSTLLGGAILAVALAWAVSAIAGKPQPPAPEPSKIIYGDVGGTFYSMNPDGSEKTAFPFGVAGVPSTKRHGSHYWFLVGRELPTYPDGDPRWEIFAVRDDLDESLTVQLTDDPDREVMLNGVTPDAAWGLDDASISWVATEFDSDHLPEGGGIYRAEIRFDADGNVFGLVVEPSAPTVDIGLIPDPEHPEDPSVLVLDVGWRHGPSPDGNHFVFPHRLGALVVAHLEGDPPVLEEIGPVAGEPSWSPAGDKILYSNGYGLLTINIDGSSERVIAPNDWDLLIANGGGVWSPDAAFVAFRNDRPLKRGSHLRLWSVYTCPSTGGRPTDLTRDSPEREHGPFWVAGWSRY